jgi:lysophospholipase L1-like esterase
MRFKQHLLITVSLLLSIILVAPVLAFTPAPLISRGKPLFGSPSAPAALVNGKFGESAWNAPAGSWVAINVGAGPSKIFITWNCTNYMWSNTIATPNCPQNLTVPVAYSIGTSSNSTNGADGTWAAAAVTVTNNGVAARGHLIDFAGASWVKMSVTTGSGPIDEIEVFDASNGNQDSWFFAGTSITANAFKGPVPSENFAALVTKAYPAFTPAIIRGGIGCIKSADFARDMGLYLQMVGNVRHFCVEMGTNDAWGGKNDGAAAFKADLQRVIDSCKAHDIQPVLARTIATDSAKAGWEVHPDFLAAIDALTASNNLTAGPDLYTWFKSHPGELNSDGVHPSATGGASMQRLWKEAMSPLYAANTIAQRQRGASFTGAYTSIVSVTSKHGRMILKSRFDGRVEVYDTRGALLFKKEMTARQPAVVNIRNGLYVVRIINNQAAPIEPVVFHATR